MNKISISSVDFVKMSGVHVSKDLSRDLRCKETLKEQVKYLK